MVWGFCVSSFELCQFVFLPVSLFGLRCRLSAVGYCLPYVTFFELVLLLYGDLTMFAYLKGSGCQCIEN